MTIQTPAASPANAASPARPDIARNEALRHAAARRRAVGRWPALAILCAAVLTAAVAHPAEPALAVARQGAGSSSVSEGAAGSAGSASANAADPVVAEVLAMFQNGLTEPVITHWLEKSGQRPARVTSADLVALHKAGASDDFLKKLVDMAGTPAPPPAAPAPAAPAAPAPPAAQPAPAAPERAPEAAPALMPAPMQTAPAVVPPAAAPPPPSGAAPRGPSPGMVQVRLAVSYRPVLQEDEEPWILVVYADGRFLASFKASRLPVPLPPQHVEVELPPGRHVLRVAEERHIRYSKVIGYLSPSRVDPDDFPVTLTAGRAAEIEIRFGDRSIRHVGPVEVRVREDGKDVAQMEPERQDSETWPALCEDVERALPKGARVNQDARRDREHCVHWAALWPEVPGVPARDEVDAEIERRVHSGGI